MQHNKRFEYARQELEELRQEIKELEAENKTIRKELVYRERLLADKENSYEELKAAYEACLTEKAEYAEKVAEAMSFYEEAASEARRIGDGYRELIARLNIEVGKLPVREAV